MIRARMISAATFIVVVFIAGVIQAAVTFNNVGLYQSFDEMVAWADALETANPDIVKVVNFGNSHQNRPLVAIQISSTPGVNNPAKPEFLFTGGVHAREVIGSEVSYQLADYLIDGYRAGNGAVLDVLAEREVWIVPTLNPDGRFMVENGFSQHRKNMQEYEGQTLYTRGVDLNRNFPHQWSRANSNVTSEVYRGPNVLSTPEAAALWTLLHDTTYFSQLLSAIDFHSGIESILTPWISSASYSVDSPLPSTDDKKFEQFATEINTRTGYPINDLSYNAYGTLTDSLYEEFGAYAICVELYRKYSSDYFVLFNPTDQAGIDSVVDKAISSSMYLLSDEAFALVPEPSVWVMLLFVVGFFVLRKRNR